MRISVKLLTAGVVFLGLLTGFYACQKDNGNVAVTPATVTQIDASQNYSQAQQDADRHNAESLMKTVIFGLLPATTDETFRNTVHQEVNKRFDGDFNVLLKDLNTVVPIEQMIGDNVQKEAVLTHDINSAEVEIRDAEDDGLAPEVFQQKEKIRQAVNGSYFLNKKYYLQIFIPFSDEVNLKQTPTLIMGAHKKVSKRRSTDEDMEAYQLQSNGKIKKMVVNEAYAKKNLVWVISINERVGNNGLINQDDNLSNEPQVELRASQTEVRASEVRITDLKEGWWQGGADVAFSGWQENPNTCGRTIPIVTNKLFNVEKNELNTFVKNSASVDKTGGVLWHPQQQSAAEPNRILVLIMFEHDFLLFGERTINLKDVRGTCAVGTTGISSSDQEYATFGISSFPQAGLINHTTTTTLIKQFNDPNTSSLKISSRKIP